MNINKKILYVCSGPANLIDSYKHWEKGEQDPTEVSITFSSQILDYCRSNQADIYMTSTNTNCDSFENENVTIEHRLKPKIPFVGKSLSYQLGEISYGLKLLWKALHFRADIALVDSGSTHYVMFFLFRLFGIKVVNILHNTLWPAGFRPTSLFSRFRSRCDKAFFIYGANAILGVSKECEKQVLELCGEEQVITEKLFNFRAQFNKEYFDQISAPPPHEQRPFKVMFIGRVESYKGVFDIIKIAEKLHEKYPNQFQWVICGKGPALEELRGLSREMGLTSIIDIPGWVSLEQLGDIYRSCHLSIVPTTSGFREGLAMSAAESVLSGRPVITSPVVPALGEMKEACYEAITNDIDSYVEGIEKVALNSELYEKMRLACPSESLQFLDRAQGLTAVLQKALAKI